MLNRKFLATLLAIYVYYWSVSRLWSQVVVPLLLGHLEELATSFLINILVVPIYIIGVTLTILGAPLARLFGITTLVISGTGTLASIISELSAEGLVTPTALAWVLSFTDLFGAGFLYSTTILLQVISNVIGAPANILHTVTQLSSIQRATIYAGSASALAAFWILILRKNWKTKYQ